MDAFNRMDDPAFRLQEISADNAALRTALGNALAELAELKAREGFIVLVEPTGPSTRAFGPFPLDSIAEGFAELAGAELGGPATVIAFHPPTDLLDGFGGELDAAADQMVADGWMTDSRHQVARVIHLNTTKAAEAPTSTAHHLSTHNTKGTTSHE